jgi:DNA-binding response OmpR family regulator
MEPETWNLEPETRNQKPVTEKSPSGDLGVVKPLLLIVEDNSDMRYYIRSYFEKDYSVLEAGDGREGILLAREHLPDIIVSDVMMPEMNGIEFCRKIKSNELTGHIPLILLTARASKESRLEGLETGADDFITKPFDGEELVIRVNNLITQRIRLKERFRKEFEQSADMHSTARLSLDQQFLQKAINIIEKHLSDTDFNVQQFAGEMALSRVQLHRKFTAIVNRNATDFIRIYRLNKAAEMLIHKTATIAEIAYDVGFSSPSYFSECFKKQYGVSPTEYAVTDR